jgi:cysteine desulfurase
VIYLDHNATTPVAPEVLEAMLPCLTSAWGNPSSTYQFGSRLKTVIETAREQVAELLGASPREILFTSGGTEANNTALQAALRANPTRRHIITSAVEHSSVLEPCRALEQEGYRVTRLPVDREGLLSLTDLENALSDDTAVVSLQWANNETGVLFPVREIAERCRARGVLFHCDAVQAVGKLEVDVRRVPVDYLTLSGHKFHAPKGVGALYVRRQAPFTPLIRGGHQEQDRRGGTEAVPLIVGLGRAAELARQRLPDYAARVRPLRDALEAGLLNTLPDTERNGHPTLRLANTTNLTFRGVEAEALLILLDLEGICASAGSACLAGAAEPSHVIRAMKPDTANAREMIRFSLGPENTPQEIETTLAAVRRVVNSLRR